jgi:hypothetical protein
MTCVIRPLGECDPRIAAITLERDDMRLVIKTVLALIQSNHGELCLDVRFFVVT